jgi:type IV secretory pathway VirB10-like protein
MAEYALDSNRLLTDSEIAAYKAAIELCRKQRALFAKIVELNIPRNLIPATKRRPGRPSTKEVEAIKSSRGGKSKAKAASATPKKRGRPAKAKAEVPAETAATPKRRGRPPKAKTESKPSALNGAGTLTETTEA